MEKKDEINRIMYAIVLVEDFSARYEVRPKKVFDYLHRYGGFDFFLDQYNILHTLSFEDMLDAVVGVCERNGGKIDDITD